MKKKDTSHSPSTYDFLAGKSVKAVALYQHLIAAFNQVGKVIAYPTKSMIAILNGQRRITWITAMGRDFIHVVFPFRKPYNDTLCFIKIAQVPGDAHQFNHHFRMYATDDINEKVHHFIKLASDGETPTGY